MTKPGDKLKVSPEVDRMVNDFFAKALTCDAHGAVTGARISRREIDWVIFGMRPPTVPRDLFELFSNFRQRGDVDPVRLEIHSQWRERLGVMAKNVEVSYQERESRLAPIDLLKLYACNPKDNPTEATLVGKMYLHGTFDTPRDFQYAKHLLVEAADHGNAEAAYLLATGRIVEDTSSKRKRPGPYLLDDERLRENYLQQARDANYKRVFDEDKSKLQQDTEGLGIHDLNVDFFYKQLKDDCVSLEVNAQAGDAGAQIGMALGLLEMAERLLSQYPQLLSRDKQTQENYRSMRRAAREWFVKASSVSSLGRYLLATKLPQSDADKFSLLTSSAFPEEEIAPCRLAVVPLVCNHYLNPASEHYDTAKGLRYLREFLEQCLSDAINPEPILDSECSDSCLVEFLHAQKDEQEKAALCLADHIINHPEDGKEQEAYYLFRAVANKNPSAAYAALQAGLMELRGQGCEGNLDRAKDRIASARKAKAYSQRNIRAAQYADALYRLGFESHHHHMLAVERFLEIAEETDFQGDPDCPVLPEDIASLAKQNPHLKEYRQYRDEIRSYRNRVEVASPPFGLVPDYSDIAEGLAWVLQTKKAIPRESLSKLWNDDSSMFENYAWGKLEISGRLVPTAASFQESGAEQLLQRVIDLEHALTATDNPHPPDFQERSRADWLRKRAERTISSSLKAQLTLEKVNKEAQVQRAREETKKDMLSYLTHTLNNTLAAAPETARQAIRLIERDVRDDSGRPRAISNIAAMLSTFLLAQQLMQTFRHYIADPDDLRNNWYKNRGSNASIRQVLALSLRQSLSQLLFSGSHLASLRRLLPDATTSDIEASFIHDVIPLEPDEPGAELILEWVRKKLGILDVSVSQDAEIPIGRDSGRFMFLYSTFSELIFNAIKYSDGVNPVAVSWRRTEAADAVFRVENSWSKNSTSGAEGTGRGLDFIKRMAELLGASFEKKCEGNRFVAILCFPKELFMETS
jgi:TPR repeat protein/signal transduction histidine kinase